MGIETDYLVVGAGACGMAFTDTLIAHSDADVILVDKRHRPGGHWNDDYQFVRLHQPSAYYGVESRALGGDRLDETGPNAGFYERASGAEVCDYYGRVLDETLLNSGRVRFRAMHEYVGNGKAHNVTSLLTGRTETVRVRRKVVDATYIATSIPSLHKPAFSADPAVRVISPNELVNLGGPASGFTVIGAGKTSMDTCAWLLDQGIPPDSIRWIRPRDPLIIDRRWTQPLSLMGSMWEWLALQNEAAVAATGELDLLRLVEENGALRRLDDEVEPTVYRGATLSEAERSSLHTIQNVVRLGRVRHIGHTEIELDHGTIPTAATQVHIDCTAEGLGTPRARPIFENGRITIQRVQAGVDPFSAALIGRVEATGRDDDEMNRLCPPNAAYGPAIKLARAMLITLSARVAWIADPEIRDWVSRTRLSATHDAQKYMTEEARASARRLFESTAPAIENLTRIIGADAVK